MKTDILTPKSLFQKDIRYTIPEFQRPYVWNQEEQWEPLWDDVRNTAEQYLEELDRSDNNSVEAEQRTPPHFLGAVVLQQVQTPSKDLEQREVIDGQQRITTLQLLLDAVQYVCEELELKPEAKRLAKLVTNDEDLITDENQVFKLWPSRSNREAFKHAMDNGLPTNEYEDSLIVQAHQFFQTQAREWLKSDPTATSRCIEALEAIVSGRLQMVVIDLNYDDNPHIIFETLNARGTPLLESDLIKNYAMSRLDQRRQADLLWGNLDDEWWREEIGRGRMRRPRIDVLLNYWLAMRTTDEVFLGSTFNKFKDHADKLPIDDVMSEVRRDLENYRLFEIGPRKPDEDMFHYRAQVMQAGAITPVLLLLLSAPYEKRVKALQALESFLIRRMVCLGSTKDYNRLTLNLVGELRKQGLDNADSVVPNFLKRQTADSREWPDDEALTYSLETLPLYRMLTMGRLRLILEGIERKLRIPMSEEQEVPRNLTIEHVMPQSWEANWPLPEGAEEVERTDNRNRLVHTIGNLTLVNRRLNATLSNAPWDNKRQTLAGHSVLLLNKVLLEESQDAIWDEQFIQSRSKRMAALIADVWPGPNSSVWNE